MKVSDLFIWGGCMSVNSQYTFFHFSPDEVVENVFSFLKSDSFVKRNSLDDKVIIATAVVCKSWKHDSRLRG